MATNELNELTKMLKEMKAHYTDIEEMKIVCTKKEYERLFGQNPTEQSAIKYYLDYPIEIIEEKTEHFVIVDSQIYIIPQTKIVKVVYENTNPALKFGVYTFNDN